MSHHLQFSAVGYKSSDTLYQGNYVQPSKWAANCPDIAGNRTVVIRKIEEPGINHIQYSISIQAARVGLRKVVLDPVTSLDDAKEIAQRWYDKQRRRAEKGRLI